MGFDQTRNASRPVKWVFDPFRDELDRNVTFTHGLGGPCYGVEIRRLWPLTNCAERRPLGSDWSERWCNRMRF